MGEVWPPREGLTGFRTTSTGNSRYANWDQGRPSCLSQLRLIVLKLSYSGDKTKAGRAQQNLREVLTRSSLRSFGIDIQNLNACTEQQNILSTFEGWRQWQEKARGADGQFAASKVFSLIFHQFFHIFFLTTDPCPTLLRQRRRSQLQISGRSERGSWKVPKTSPSTISVHNACRLERCTRCLFCIPFAQRVGPNLHFWLLKSVKYFCSSYFSF